jgi:AAHS family 3-hydroxyphenylpropionic acid transporter
MNEQIARPALRPGALTVALCGLIAIFEGFDLQSAGVAAPKLVPALGLVPSQMGWFFSASTFGLMLGAVIGGRLSDSFGRKIALVFSVFVFGLLSIATGFARDFDQLLIARFLTGIGLGGALPNLLALVAENMPLARRGGAVGLLYAGMPCGGVLASISSLHPDWRMIFYIGGIAPLAVLPLVAWKLPDSMAHEIGKPAQGFGRALFSWVSGGLWLSFFLGLLIMYLLLMWLPTLLISHGLTKNQAALVQVSFNLCGAIGAFSAGWLADQPKWRTAAVLSVFLAAGITLACAGALPNTMIANLVFGGALGGSVMGGQAILYGLAPSLYPTAVRGTGVGAAVSMGRFGSAAGPLLAGQLVAAGWGPTQVLLVLLPVLAVAGVGTTALSLRPAED